MKKIFSLILFSLVLSYASYGLSPFLPSSGTLCTGSSLYLTDSLDPGGVWTSSSPSIATIGSSSGIMTGVSAGVVTITYTLGVSSVTGMFTVNTAPAAITGGGTAFCIGSSITLADATPGGTWSSGSTYIATVGASTGIVTGAHTGTTSIIYTLPSGCAAYKTVTVGVTPISSISGPGTVCLGTTITLTDSVSGGTWSSSSTGIATVGASTGVVTGVSAGTATITYSLSGSCGTVYVTRTVTVSSTTMAPGSITGPSTVMVGASITLSDSISGGTWSSATTGIATVGASTGVVTGVATGVATISYTVTGCGGAISTSTTVNVIPFDGIFGHVIFSSPLYGSVKVWLITYNTTTHLLAAIDSTNVICYGTSVAYNFMSVSTDSFRVKASADDTLFSTTGFIPTYHPNNFYWHDATAFYHTSGTADTGKDINMAYGTITSGPGFIAGDVTTGANKGTSGSSPAVGVHVCAVNSSTLQMIQQTYTDATGHYSFSNLPVGQTYYVFPDSLNYLTTPYTGITLTASAPGMTTASFTEHTISKTITPKTEGVVNTTTGASVTVSPNPTTGMLNIAWTNQVTGNATLVINDMSGREVFTAQININNTTGSKQIDLGSLKDGMYFFHTVSDNFNYAGKLLIRK